MAATGKKKRNTNELLAAAAVGLIAFWAPASDSGLVMRVITAMLALAALFVATVGLEMMEEYKATQAKKANVFDVVVKKVEVPTAPPGGVFAAAAKMDEYLNGFPLKRSSDIKALESGFQVLTGSEKLRVKVNGGFANGWEVGGEDWLKQRDLWMRAVAAAPRATAAREANWMGVAQLEPAPPPAPSESAKPLEVGECVVVEGIQSKPELNGKHGTVVKGPNENGRLGVRLEGAREAMLLNAKNLQPMAGFDGLGVSIPCMRAFRANFAELLSGMTAAEACSDVTMPLCASARCSLAQALSRLGAKDEAGRPLTRAATVLLCHAETDRIDAVFDAAEAHAARQEKPEEVYVRLDLFCANFHAETPPMVWWQSAFRRGVKAIGKTALLLQHEEPLALRRSWCLWQLLCTLHEEAELSVEMPKAEDEKMQAALLDDMDVVTKALSAVCETGLRLKAECAAPEQRAMVDKAIAATEGGFEEFGKELLDHLQGWLLECALRALERVPKEERGTCKLLDRVAQLQQEQGKLEDAEPLLREIVGARKKKLGARDEKYLEAVNSMALLLHQLGKLEEAEPFSKEKLAGCRASHGDGHPDTITAIDTLSQLLSDLGKLEEAVPLKRESLFVKRKSLGDRHPDTLLSVNNLAVLLNDLGRATGNPRMLREAEPLKREALAGCRDVLGNRHPHTLASIANLADMLMQLGHADPRALEEAEPLCREALSGSREVLGEGHPDTLKSAGTLAALLVERVHQQRKKDDRKRREKWLQEALALYRETVGGFRAALGGVHPSTLSYVNEMARVMLDLGDAKGAEREQRDSVAGCRAALGDTHPETLICITHLAGLLRAQNKYGDAEPLCREVLAAWRAHEAKEPVPRNTLTSINILAELLHVQGKDAEAEPLCREVLGGFTRALGEEHPFTVSSAENLAGVLGSLKRQDEADSILAKFNLKRPPGPPGAALAEEDFPPAEGDADDDGAAIPEVD